MMLPVSVSEAYNLLQETATFAWVPEVRLGHWV